MVMGVTVMQNIAARLAILTALVFALGCGDDSGSEQASLSDDMAPQSCVEDGCDPADGAADTIDTDSVNADAADDGGDKVSTPCGDTHCGSNATCHAADGTCVRHMGLLGNPHEGWVASDQ